MDFILNGIASGGMASRYLEAGGDVRAFRPFCENGRNYILRRNSDGKPRLVRTNADAMLRKDEWIELDKAVVATAQPRLKFVSDLRSRGLEYNLRGGLGASVLESQRMSDISDAELSMDGLRETNNDRPVFDIVGVPLPIVSKDFDLSARHIQQSRRMGTPIDTLAAQQAAIKVTQMIEKIFLGIGPTLGAFGGYSLYGAITSPALIPFDLTAPTESGWSPATFVDEVLQMIELANNQNHFGPFMLYHGLAWNRYMGGDYSTQKGDNTLRDRVRDIDMIEDVRTLDYLTEYKVILVEMSVETVRAIIAQELVTVQWEEKGGLLQKFKVMASITPQFREDYAGNSGLVYGVPA